MAGGGRARASRYGDLACSSRARDAGKTGGRRLLPIEGAAPDDLLDGSPADYFGVGVRSLMGDEIRGCRREQQQSRTRDDARAIHTVASRLSALRCSNGAMHMSAQVTGAVVFAQSALYVI